MMEAEPGKKLEALLASSDPEQLRKGLQLVKEEISRVGSEEARPLFEMVSAIFYLDPFDRPEMAPVIEEAVSLVVGFGKWVIPVLVQNLDQGDLKAQMATADALGRLGADAIEPMVAKYRSADDPSARAFVLYALGKIKSPKILEAAPVALKASRSSDRELRDTAARAIGRFAESIPAAGLPDEVRAGFHDSLRTHLADPNPGIRAKAIRSLGKLARHGHLTETERDELRDICRHLLGTDEKFDWDRAYVVRKEAEQALEHLRS